ncbi:MAG: leucyl aminopeptidase [bacterium]|nr:leucyl aminopeptidase [bacterium]
MEIRARKGSLATLKTELYVLGLFKGEALFGDVAVLAAHFPLEAALQHDFKGEKGEQLLLLPTGACPVRRVLLLGLGERGKFSLKAATEIYGGLMLSLREKSFRDAVVEFPLLEEDGPVPADLALALGRALKVGSWRFERYKSKPKTSTLANLALRAGEQPAKPLTDAFLRGALIGEGVNHARDLAQEPGNTVTPGFLADNARAIAAASGGKVKTRVLGEAQLRKLGAGGILAVGQGSREESRLIALEYRCGKPKARRLAFIGKGITFDSGGISIKPSAQMEEMKYDMCGAAAVLGLFQVIARLAPGVDVLGVIPAAENLPDGQAYKPGDIIRLLCGKTVEVVNTDAEGRLLLCDALSWAERTFQPDAMVDLATLTGAVLICLGHEMSAVLGNDPAMVEAVVDAGSRSGDVCWPLPLAEDYKAMVKSPVADIRNSTNTREAGTITAACFLNEAVSEETPWAHIDIAGTAWVAKKAGYPAGPTGVGVHLLAELLDTFAG